MKKDHAILVRTPDGQFKGMSDRQFRHDLGAQKGGRNNTRRYQWTSETARKAALKSWRKRKHLFRRHRTPKLDLSQCTVVRHVHSRGRHDTKDGLLIQWKAKPTTPHA